MQKITNVFLSATSYDSCRALRRLWRYSAAHCWRPCSCVHFRSTDSALESMVWRWKSPGPSKVPIVRATLSTKIVPHGSVRCERCMSCTNWRKTLTGQLALPTTREVRRNCGNRCLVSWNETRTHRNPLRHWQRSSSHRVIDQFLIWRSCRRSSSGSSLNSWERILLSVTWCHLFSQRTVKVTRRRRPLWKSSRTSLMLQTVRRWHCRACQTWVLHLIPSIIRSFFVGSRHRMVSVGKCCSGSLHSFLTGHKSLLLLVWYQRRRVFYRVAQKTGPAYLIANIVKTPWPNCVEIGELLQFYMLNTVINFKNFIALWRHLAKTQLLCDAQIYLYSVNKRQ